MMGNNNTRARLLKKCLKINILTREFWVIRRCYCCCRLLYCLRMNVDYYYFLFVPLSLLLLLFLLRFIYSIYLIMFALVFSLLLLFCCCCCWCYCCCFRYYYCCHLPFTEEHYLIPFSITITLYDGARFIMMVFYCLLLLVLMPVLLMLLLLPLSPLPLPWPLPQFHSAVFHCNMFCMCVIDQLFRTFRIVSI